MLQGVTELYIELSTLICFELSEFISFQLLYGHICRTEYWLVESHKVVQLKLVRSDAYLDIKAKRMVAYKV